MLAELDPRHGAQRRQRRGKLWARRVRRVFCLIEGVLILVKVVMFWMDALKRIVSGVDVPQLSRARPKRQAEVADVWVDLSMSPPRTLSAPALSLACLEAYSVYWKYLIHLKIFRQWRNFSLIRVNMGESWILFRSGAPLVQLLASDSTGDRTTCRFNTDCLVHQEVYVQTVTMNP